MFAVPDSSAPLLSTGPADGLLEFFGASAVLSDPGSVGGRTRRLFSSVSGLTSTRRCVVVVEQLAAEFEVELAAELVDALADVSRLQFDVLLVVETGLHRHESSSLSARARGRGRLVCLRRMAQVLTSKSLRLRANNSIIYQVGAPRALGLGVYELFFAETARCSRLLAFRSGCITSVLKLAVPLRAWGGDLALKKTGQAGVVVPLRA